MSEHVGFAVSRKREVRVCSKESQCFFSHLSTVGSHSSKHAGTKGCSISETILFVYKTEHFPFNAQQNIYEYHYMGSSDK